MTSSFCFMYWPVKYTLTSDPLKLRGLGELQSPQIFAKVDLLPIDNDSDKKKGAKKHKPYQIPRKLQVTLLLSV